LFGIGIKFAKRPVDFYSLAKSVVPRFLLKAGNKKLKIAKKRGLAVFRQCLHSAEARDRLIEALRAQNATPFGAHQACLVASPPTESTKDL
jgi:hypothetical protein